MTYQLCGLPVNPVCRVERIFDFPNPLAPWQHQREIPLALRPHPAPAGKNWGVDLQSAFERVRGREMEDPSKSSLGGNWGQRWQLGHRPSQVIGRLLIEGCQQQAIGAKPLTYFLPRLRTVVFKRPCPDPALESWETRLRNLPFQQLPQAVVPHTAVSEPPAL